MRPGTTVLDVGCASGYVARALRDKDCQVTGIDRFAPSGELPDADFVLHDLDQPLPRALRPYDYVLLLDVIEHLRAPEQFVEDLRASLHQTERATIIVSTANIAFFVTRFMLLLGHFHYGTRGILDLTHTRLFTFATLTRLFEQAGYRIDEVRGVPAPFPLALRSNRLARLLVGINKLLIRLSRSLFSYQIFIVVRPLPSLEWLLDRAAESRRERIARQSP